MYALNIAEDGRILSVTFEQFAMGDMPIVETLPGGDYNDYRYEASVPEENPDEGIMPVEEVPLPEPLEPPAEEPPVAPDGLPVFPGEDYTPPAPESEKHGVYDPDPKYIYDPLPKPEPEPAQPTQMDILEAQVTYTAVQTGTLIHRPAKEGTAHV